MEDYFLILSERERVIFATLADFAMSLGYKPRKDRAISLGYTFQHNKLKKTILRFSTQHGEPILKLRFYATQQYSHFFHEAIRRTIEEYDFRYTGCYGCGINCGSTQGYYYEYPDGKKHYRCGTELIEIVDLENLPLTETLELIKNQHEFTVRQMNIQLPSLDDNR